MMSRARFLICKSRRPTSDGAAAGARITIGASSSSSSQVADVLHDGVGRHDGGLAVTKDIVHGDGGRRRIHREAAPEIFLIVDCEVKIGILNAISVFTMIE
jgi:hypothetical protein